MRGKICLVTGATNGLGRATATALAARGAEVVLLGRNEGRCRAVSAEIATETGAFPPTILVCDLASLADIARAADEYTASGRRLDVLVNNAGVVNRQRRETVDGLEETFAVNHLGYFALALRLLPVLRANAPTRIVNVASHAHRFSPLDFDDLQHERHYGAMRVYGRSKLANLYFTFELARRLEGSGVTVNAVHPGAVATGLGMNNEGLLIKVASVLSRLFFRAPGDAAATSIHAATAPELIDQTGLYLANSAPCEPHAHARDRAAAARLWEISERLAGVALDDDGIVRLERRSQP